MVLKNPLRRDPVLSTKLLPKLEPDLVAALPQLEHYHFPGHLATNLLSNPRDGTLVGYTFSKRYKKVSPHRKSHNLLYNLLKEKNKPPQEMVNKRGVPFGPTWLTRTLETGPCMAIF